MTSRRTRGLLALTIAVAIPAVPGLLSAPSASGAQSVSAPTMSLPGTGAGIDVSFPQCTGASHEDYPANVPFGIVGVNHGSANNVNPCFSSEFNSAFLLGGTTDQPHAAVYVNTGNPALAGVWWPTVDVTEAGTPVVNPGGPCAGLAGAACAYVYGYSMAEADYRRVHKTLLGMPSMWWLDVETSNTWQTDLVANSASISGMVDYFKSRHLEVGLYSTSYQWGKIAGQTPANSDLAGLPSWLAGGSFHGAPADCEKSPLTPNGRVAMVQYVMHLDNDYSCRRFASSTATISPDTIALVGSQLTAQSGTWDAGPVAYSYQWNRDGSPIDGATSSTYELTAADAGTEVTVTITGLESGFSAASKTSFAVAVLGSATS